MLLLVDAAEGPLPQTRYVLQKAMARRLPVVVALNQFPSDTDAELSAIVEHCAELGIPAVPANVFGEGGAGGERLAGLAREFGEIDGYWARTACERATDLSPEDLFERRWARAILDRALRRLGARKMKTVEVPVIFDPETAAST